jgi:hypothetical protein
MGRFDEDLFCEIAGYMAATYPTIASLVRKDFNEAATLFTDRSVDLLHIDGTHTFEAVSNDYHTWLPKLSDRAVVLFHDVNVTVENTGEAALRFGVRKFFDSVKEQYPNFEFPHCWGLGVLVTGQNAPPAVMELVEMARSPEFSAFFAAKGEQVSRRFEAMGVPLPVHGAYSPAAPRRHRAINKLHRILRRLLRIVRPA